MRLWSIHPEYLDSRGLVALWREGLLARKVLTAATKGYRNHPQLKRFKNVADPILAIDAYLSVVLRESQRRGYSFDASKIRRRQTWPTIPVTRGQAMYELMHLKRKLKERDYDVYLRLEKVQVPKPHPLFKLVEGSIEDWEKPLINQGAHRSE